MSKFAEKIGDIKEKIDVRKTERNERREASKSFRAVQKGIEQQWINKLKTLPEGSQEAEAILDQLTKLGNLHSNDRVSADNICAAITSIGGLTGAVAYNERHNLPKEASNFIRKPGREPRVKASQK